MDILIIIIVLCLLLFFIKKSSHKLSDNIPSIVLYILFFVIYYFIIGYTISIVIMMLGTKGTDITDNGLWAYGIIIGGIMALILSYITVKKIKGD